MNWPWRRQDYRLTVRMEWLDRTWADCTLTVRARNLAAAAAMAIRQAQQGTDTGWSRVSVALDPAHIVDIGFRPGKGRAA